MSATIVILPIISRPNPNEVGRRALRIVVDRNTLSRVRRRAEEWNMSVEEAASAIITAALQIQHKGRAP
jgi:hypothetical protein